MLVGYVRFVDTYGRTYLQTVRIYQQYPTANNIQLPTRTCRRVGFFIFQRLGFFLMLYLAAPESILSSIFGNSIHLQIRHKA
jgi:hypothetical protein